MNKDQYIKTDKAMKFILSFGDIKMITTVFGIIDMHVEDSSNESLVYIEPKGDIKKHPSMSDAIKLEDTSEQKEWKSFVLRNVRIYIKQMIKELEAHVVIAGYIELEEIKKLIAEYNTKLKKQFSSQNIDSKMFAYNSKLQESKISNKEELELHNHSGAYIKLLESIKEYFEYQTKTLDKHYAARIEELSKDKDSPSVNAEIIVDHRLRWNTREDSIVDHFHDLIDNKMITLATRDGSKEEILEILKMVLEEVEPPEKKSEIFSVNGRIHLDKEPFTIPEQLLWKGKTKSFKREISPLVNNPKTIFIEQFENKLRGETPAVARILQQVMLMPYDDGNGLWEESVVIKYLREPEGKFKDSKE